MYHRILFLLVLEYGFHDSYIAACRQLYSASTTYYIIIHGNTAPLPICRGTLQGDTLSLFLFTIFMEPLQRWLAVGSRGYRPTYQPHKRNSTIITYDDHDFSDDVSITAGSIEYLKIQLKNMHMFSQYTGQQLKTSKCEATGSLLAHGNPPNLKNRTMLQEQINSITFVDGTHIRYLPPNKSCSCSVTGLQVHVGWLWPRCDAI